MSTFAADLPAPDFERRYLARLAEVFDHHPDLADAPTFGATLYTGQVMGA